ncbi:MAG: hypothetical protein ACXWQ5_00055 [Ktedonobacterales bacterium]
MAVVHDRETESFSLQRNEDGSVTLTQAEYEEWAEAYNAIYRKLDGPACIGDFFDRDFFYGVVHKWHIMTLYGAYGPEEYDGNDEGYYPFDDDEDEAVEAVSA